MPQDLLKRIEMALGDDNNPNKYSLLFALSSMATQLEEYKKLGTVEELAKYKRIALTKQNGDNL